MAHVRNGRGFHLNGHSLREVMTDFRQTNRAVDKGIAADDQATHRIEVQLVDAAFSGGNQLIIRFKPGRAARKLTIFVAECGDVCIVVTRFVGNHDIAHFQRRRPDRPQNLY